MDNTQTPFTERKTDTEILPAALDPAVVETWLEDKAKDGWQLSGFDTRFFRVAGTFDRAAPRPTRYRLTPLARKEKEPEEERLELCEAQGWHYAATIPALFHVWRTDDESAPEMDTDPVTQAEGYRWLRRQAWWGILWVVVPLAALAAFYGLVTSGGWLLVNARASAPGSAAILLVLFAAMALDVVFRIRTLRRLYHRLHTGVPMDRPVPYRRKQTLQWVAWLIGVALYFYIVGNGLFGLDEYKWIADDPAAMARAKYVSLADLGSAVEHPDLWAERKTTELFPELYQVTEYALAPRTSPSGTWETEYHIETEYYRTWTAGLAKELERELVKDVVHDRGKYPSIWPDMTRRPAPDLDSFWWGSLPAVETDGRGDVQYVVARLRSRVLTAYYTGPTDLRESTGVLAAVLAK